MFRRPLRTCLIAGLLAVLIGTSMLTPGLWHVHEGGDVAHDHSGNGHVSPDGHRHGGRDHGTHSHSHGGHLHGHSHSHVGHHHAHDHATVAGDKRTEGNPRRQIASVHDGVARSPAWHVHFSLFGFELTLQAPSPVGKVKSVMAGTTCGPRRNRHFTHSAPLTVSPADLFLSDYSGAQSLTGPRWESGPPPTKFEPPEAGRSTSLPAMCPEAAGCDRARPPVPPPRGPMAENSLRDGLRAGTG